MTHDHQRPFLLPPLQRRGYWQHRARLRRCWGLALALAAASCGAQSALDTPLPDLADEQEQEDAQKRPAGWSEESHSNDVPPNYEVVFLQAEVGRFDLTIGAEDWQAMLDDLTALLGPFGLASQQPPPDGQQPPPDGQQPPPPDGQQPPPEALAACEGQTAGAPCAFTLETNQISGSCMALGDELACAPAGGPTGPGAGPAAGPLAEQNPIWVPCTLAFNGQTWTQVGIRFKGFSSLRTSWQQGIAKLPLRLDLDEFEDEVPEIKNQRLYGFKKLALSNAFHDPSFLRDKIVSDLLRAGGVPAARTAFYRVYLDHGEGPQYLGLYTLIEVPDDPLLQSQLGSANGNLYKPDGRGADFTEFAEEGFAKKSNEEEADFSDVQAAIAALHAPGEDAATWRAGLEATFDVQGFLRWLAYNTLIQNWDSYGNIAHNYFLYGDPEDGGRLRWIPWDHNEALKQTDRALSLSLDEVDARWPLIRSLLDDASYADSYYGYLAEALQGAFAAKTVEQQLRTAHALVEPYAVGAEGEQAGFTHLTSPDAFYAELQALIEHVNQRHAAAAQALAARQ